MMSYVDIVDGKGIVSSYEVDPIVYEYVKKLELELFDLQASNSKEKGKP